MALLRHLLVTLFTLAIATLTVAKQPQKTAEKGRILSIFDKYEEQGWDGFNVKLIMEVFNETKTAEFLYDDTLMLIDELLLDFPELLETMAIGYSVEKRPL